MSNFRPGMSVKVTNPDDIYYGFEGQVQRMIDGTVGVIFTKSIWIKLVTFKATDLVLVERTAAKK